MSNLYAQFLKLLPDPPLLVGLVVQVLDGGCMIRLPTGEVLRARGVAALGQSVFFRDGTIEGNAPNLTVFQIEI